MVNKPGVSSERTSITAWKNTKVMNMHDLSRDDDFLSHLLVEKLGTATIPLLVHKMDPSRFVPKVKVEELMTIVRRMIQTKGPPQNVIREAVTQLLYISAVRWYTKSFTQKQLNAFATHASRYFELYLPTGSIEIAHTQRYTHRTGKSELCILATRPLAPGTVITELKGSMADLTEQEDQELKSTDRRQPSGGIRRDFSVIHSKQLKKNHLFLGPARFVNHDCDNNCELFREGRYITFRVIRPIAIGEEVTAHYGDAYFGRGNRHCLCETCERNGVGGYGPQAADDLSDGGSSDVEPEGDEAQPEVNVNERRTRRGVYAVLKESDDEDADEEEEEPAMELQGEVETGFLSAPAASSRASSAAAKNFLTPDPEPSLSSAAGTPSMEDGRRRTRPAPAPVELVISTRGQKARAASLAAQVQSLPTPPLSDDAASLTERTSRPPRATRARLAALRGSEDMATRPSTPMDKGKAKAQASAEPEPRVLRGRQLAAASASAPPGPAPGSKLKAKEKQKEKEKQKLPTCETCLKVLPIISLDQKVIWGDFDNASGKGKGKKKEKRECPRCLRHFAIYSHSWPNRTAAQAAAFIPTPRENTPAESASRAAPQKFLPVLDKKLSMAASSSTLKRPRERSTTIEDSAPKRRKLPPPPTKPSQQRRPPDRPRGQSPVASSSRPAAATSFTPVSLPTKRKRGRPPLRQFPSRAPLAIVRVPAPSTAASQSPSRTPKSRAVDDQPRDSNGRFGKKGSSVAPTSASAPFATSDPPEVLPSTPEAEPTDFRASAMPSLNDDDLELSYPDYPEDEDEDEDDTAPESKRRRVHPDYDLGLEYLSAFEKVRDEEEEDEDDEEDDDDDENDSEPVTFAGGLSFHPNPGSFARRKWAPPLPAPESPLRRERSLPANSELEETEDHVDTYDSVVSAPVRPHRVEDDDLEYLSDVGETLQGQDQSQQDADAETVEEDDDEEEVQEVEAPIISRPRTFSSGGALWKPSPINFATRRWSEKAGQADRQALVGLDVRPPVSSGRAKYGLKLLDMWEAQGKSGRNVTQSSKTPTFHGMTQSTAAEHWDLFDLGSSSSGEEDVVLPDSPEPSKFALRSRVTFSPRPLSLSSLSKPSVVVKSVEQDAAANDQVEVTQADTPSDTQGDTSRAEVEEALLLDDRSTQVTIVGSSVQGSVNVTADEPSEVATLDSDDSSVYDYQIIHGPVEPGDDAVDKVTTDDVPENRKNDNGPVGNDPINLLTMNAAAEKLVEGVGTILDNLLKATNLFSLPGPRPFSSSTPYKLPLARKVTARPAPRSRASTGSSLPKPRKPYAHPTSPLAVPHHASSARLVDGSWDSDA